MTPWAAVFENAFTLSAAAATIVGLYAFGGGYYSLIGFLFLANLNYFKRKQP